MSNPSYHWHPYNTPDSGRISTPSQLRGDFEDVKIGDSTTFRIGRVMFEAVRLSTAGCNSGRGHFLVHCTRCEQVVTRATTGPLWNGQNHAQICKAINNAGRRYNEGVTWHTPAHRWVRCVATCAVDDKLEEL